MSTEQTLLTDDDRRSLRALAYNLKYKHSRDALDELISDSMMNIDTSPYLMEKQLEDLSGLREHVYHCCVNSCVLFAGDYIFRTHCPICEEPRYDNRNKPRNIFRYIPIIPRLQAMFKSKRMIQMLDYRSNLEAYSGIMRDVFDSEHFRELLEKNVTINGEELPYKIGEHRDDLFIGFSFDGVSLYRGLGVEQRRTSLSCWPAFAIMYSISPTLRTRLEHVMCLGIIPGPHSPKITNSFLYPFFEECSRGAIGIPTYHSVEDRMFSLHFYPIFTSMDILASIKARGTKSTGAVIPCHECPLVGTRHSDPQHRNRTYYYPHQKPGEDEPCTDDLLSNLKTHAHFLDVWNQLDQAEDPKEFESLQKEYGVTCIPILGLLPSIDIIKSFPYGLMHQLFENLCPNMVDHWRGTFTQLNSTRDVYYITPAAWKLINANTLASARLTPSWMIRLIQDLSSKLTAESWAFWFTWMAPYLLEGYLPQEHYDHFLLLTRIIKLATCLEITEEMMDELDTGIRQWHTDYER